MTEPHNCNSVGTVLIVSPYFPPSTLAGVHRARHLVRHLPSAGWTPIVLCVNEEFHEEQLDPDLASLVPKTVEIIKAAAIPSLLSHAIGIGDISLRAWWPLQKALYETLASRKIDIVLITGSPFYPMLLAPRIKSRFGIPVVLDFQDPWVSKWGASQPLMSKAGISHALGKMLEPRALRGASFVTSVSEIQNCEFAARHPWFDSRLMASIPIGGDPEDFAALDALPFDEGDLDRRFINLSFVGTFMPRSGTLFQVLFRSLRKLRTENPSLAAQIRFNFVGTSNQPNDSMNYRVLPIAEAEGVADVVHEIPQRVPYLRALGVLARSDGLLLIGSDEQHYTASKIYPALMSGRPFVSLFHRASSAHKILSAAGGGIALGFSSVEELADIEDALKDALSQLAGKPAVPVAANPSAYAPYQANAIAQKLGKIFESVVLRN